MRRSLRRGARCGAKCGFTAPLETHRATPGSVKPQVRAVQHRSTTLLISRSQVRVLPGAPTCWSPLRPFRPARSTPRTPALWGPKGSSAAAALAPVTLRDMYTSCVIEIRSWPRVVGDLAGAQTSRVEPCGDEVSERVRVQSLPRRPPTASRSCFRVLSGSRSVPLVDGNTHGPRESAWRHRSSVMTTAAA